MQDIFASVFLLYDYLTCHDSPSSRQTVSEVHVSAAVLGPPDVSLSGCGDCLLLRLGAPIAMEISPTYRVHVQRTRDGVQVRGERSLRV